MKLGDMHFAVVAHAELGGNADAREVAVKLNWRLGPGAAREIPDVRRAETALLAAAEHGFVGSPR